MMFSPEDVDEVFVGEVGRTLSAIAFDGAGTLFAIDYRPQTLLLVATTPPPPGSIFLDILAEIPLSTDLHWAGGLAVPPDDSLYLSGFVLDGADTLYELDQTTGLLTSLGATGVPGGLTSLTFVPEPASLLLLVVGAACMAKERQRKIDTTCSDREDTL
ncbi:MAG: PEP-CTERM sorting domain-containing protein [Planctomycetes bacterium]|nr:PEP-CTERM sorting domain-containing protein [Planctomycetota bacterium]